jgi:hypothetical protein
MKKLLSIMILSVLLGSSISVVSAYNSQIDDEKYVTISEKINVQTPDKRMVLENEFVRVFFDDELYLIEQNKPILPKIQKKLELPFGVKNVQVSVDMIDIDKEILTRKITRAPCMGPLNIPVNMMSKVENRKMNVNDIYPSEWFNYRVGCGLNDELEHVTHLSINIYPIKYYEKENKIEIARSFEISYEYDSPKDDFFPQNSEYDLVIIAPSKFSNELNRLIEHKNNHNVKTILKTTDDIYREYTGRDKPEQIKYFIKDAIETWDVTYVLLVGGLKSNIFAVPRDDNNQGTKGWHVPVRYTNMWDDPKFPLDSSLHDPGVISDLYYADVYKEGGVFEDWDPNNDGLIFSWGYPGYQNDTGIDYYPDVSLSRLACVNTNEVKTLVDKIINYEKQPCDPSWFRKMIVVSGDGFLDQQDWNIQWDTNGLPEGEYSIHAQSINDEGVSGPIDVINVNIDKNVETSLSFNHDDHLNPALANGYPAPPIAEIATVSNGDILGNTNYEFFPGDNLAYLNWFFFWANMSYIDGVLTIRGKSYDPKAYGITTDVHIWITDDNDNIVFSEWKNDTEMYFEGEWTTGDRELLGRGGGLYYMPDDFEKLILWTSNGGLKGESDVIEAVREGCGFLFFSGHGSPAVWGDQKPGIPGNRQHCWVTGLHVSNIGPVPPFINKLPVFPMNTLGNGEKLPIAVVGGCHNSQFNVSLIPAMMDIMPYLPILGNILPSYGLWTYGTGVPETFSWHIVSRPNGGAIASMGNTGLGYGMPAKECTTGGGDSWITIEFFRQYGEEQKDILGAAYTDTLTTYIDNFDMNDLQSGHPKTVTQWVLLGDPSLKIGGYE